MFVRTQAFGRSGLVLTCLLLTAGVLPAAAQTVPPPIKPDNTGSSVVLGRWFLDVFMGGGPVSGSIRDETLFDYPDPADMTLVNGQAGRQYQTVYGGPGNKHFNWLAKDDGRPRIGSIYRAIKPEQVELTGRFAAGLRVGRAVNRALSLYGEARLISNTLGFADEARQVVGESNASYGPAYEAMFANATSRAASSDLTFLDGGGDFTFGGGAQITFERFRVAGFTPNARVGALYRRPVGESSTFELDGHNEFTVNNARFSQTDRVTVVIDRRGGPGWTAGAGVSRAIGAGRSVLTVDWSWSSMSIPFETTFLAQPGRELATSGPTGAVVFGGKHQFANRAELQNTIGQQLPAHVAAEGTVTARTNTISVGYRYFF